MTEHLVLDTSWSAVPGTGKEIHDCLNAGWSAYVWWYIRGHRCSQHVGFACSTSLHGNKGTMTSFTPYPR